MDNSALYQFNQSINQSVNCDATATRNEHVHFSARLHDVAANLNGGIGAGQVDVTAYCYFHVFRLTNKGNYSLFAVIFFNSDTSISYVMELD